MHGTAADTGSPPLAHGQSRKRKKTGQWSDATLKAAISVVEAGGNIKTTARYFDIPPSSLADHVYGKTLSRKKGPPIVLSEEEERALKAYMIKMQEIGHPLSMQQLRLKVATIVQERVTPFRDGIPGDSWIKWFKKRHPDLTIRNSQGLEFARAKGLCPENVATFYKTLQDLYDTHGYTPDRIWNCDESGAQAGRNGGGLVWAKKGCKSVHSLIPNNREWLTVLSCISASGDHIPGFYIFKGKRLKENYIVHCESKATQAMQPEGWMTAFLFSEWLSHFINALESRGGVSPTNRHLLVVDGHNSHVTLQVVHKAMQVGLDIVTLPSHTSHALQPLDVSVFGGFKKAFRRYRDAWSLRNKGRGATKQVLAQWVSLALQKALSPSNIQAGFRATGIWPFNPSAVDKHMAPSLQFTCNQEVEVTDREEDDAEPDSAEEDDDAELDPALEALQGERIIESQPQPGVHFFVGAYEPLAEGNQSGTEPQLHAEADLVTSMSDRGAGAELLHGPHVPVPAADSLQCTAVAGCDLSNPPPPQSSPPIARGIERFLQLPEIPVQPRRRRSQEEPLVDYSKSILVTSEEYMNAMELKAERKEQARKEAERRKLEGERKREARVIEKQRKEEEKIQRTRDARAREAFAQKWTTKAIREAGERLQWLVKNVPPQADGVEDRRFYGMLPAVCKENTARRLAKRRGAKAGQRSAHLALPPNPPAWVHHCDPHFAAALEECQAT